MYAYRVLATTPLIFLLHPDIFTAMCHIHIPLPHPSPFRTTSHPRGWHSRTFYLIRSTASPRFESSLSLFAPLASAVSLLSSTASLFLLAFGRSDRRSTPPLFFLSFTWPRNYFSLDLFFFSSLQSLYNSMSLLLNTGLGPRVNLCGLSTSAV